MLIKHKNLRKIAFIGLGNMGLPMAANLLKAGFELSVFDLSASATHILGSQGAVLAASPADAATGVDAAITMLPAGEQVRAVYLGESGLIQSATPGTLLIDCSTIDVVTARAVASAALEAGLTMLDAPVSGGTSGAEAGTLTFMVGGGRDAFDAASPVLSAMGKTAVHTGSSGTGQAAKICNNMILGISMIAVCEAFALGDRLGLDRQTLFDVASKSSGQCWSLTSYCPVPGPVPASPANRDYAPGFTAAMMLKDLRLALSAGTGTGAVIELGRQAAAIYERFAKDGHGQQDFSAIFTAIDAGS